MKNKLKKSGSSEPRPDRLHLHILRLTGFALGLAVLLILFALLVVGLPPGLTNRITARVRAEGIPLQVQSIHLSIHHGWVLKNVRLYSTSPDDLQPLLNAEKIYVLPWPVDWKNPAKGGWHLKLYVKNLGVSLGRPWETVLPENHPFRTVHRLNASLTAAPGRIEVENAALDWGGINIFVHGNADISKTGDLPQSIDSRRLAAKAADALSRLKCEEPPKLRLDFNFNAVRPEETFFDASLSAKGIAWQNCIYKQLDGRLGYRDSTWTLAALQLDRSDSERLVLHGAINLDSSNAQVSAENTLSAADLFNLLPEEAQSAIAQTGVKPYGRFNFTASAGPAPVDRLAEKIDIQIQLAQIKRQDITLDPLALHLIRDGSRVYAKEIQARVNGGPLTGSFELDVPSKNWTARMQAQCDPTIAGIYDEDLREFLSRFRFPGEYPKADLTLANGPGDTVIMSGTLSADRFTCGGVPIGHLETFMTYSNQVVDLTPIHVDRDKQQFDGSVQVDFTRHLGIFNATNSFPPADIARALAPGEHTILEDFRFDGPVYAAGQGQIDYGTWTNHQFKGTFRAENAGISKLKTEFFNTDIEARGTQLLFTNTVVQLYSGSAQGSGEFDILLEDGSAPYRINARVGKLDLIQMLEQLTPGDYGRTHGQFSTTLNITADATTGFWQSVKGGGRVEITDGHLADIPLFGGFSRIIQSAFSGFNLFSLTAFSADYELHDGAIWSDNAQLGGALVSARGRGNYSMENGLNFVVAAEPLRQTGGGDKERNQIQRLAASALKETTAPIFRLLEFQLSGPLDKPEWRFANLPKEVSDLLRRGK